MGLLLLMVNEFIIVDVKEAIDPFLKILELIGKTAYEFKLKLFCFPLC
jgi:hypothetical protein